MLSIRTVHSFSSACAELTQWCSDQRAFSSYFEENLLAALQVAVENGTKDGFDFTLAHQLVSACFTHRKLLSKNSASKWTVTSSGLSFVYCGCAAGRLPAAFVHTSLRSILRLDASLEERQFLTYFSSFEDRWMELRLVYGPIHRIALYAFHLGI
ncbi:unnamed protein product [Heligmosomoides polygyrus]|uniref:ZMIZ1 N-terminal domain-containing protein n=1 Tax=Heligmosomoides polygyrus TaxID=6339 RepID=A0A3P7TH72_HELPZ|nr:unnamed protein product [Heligmosomoides polygyrus]